MAASVLGEKYQNSEWIPFYPFAVFVCTIWETKANRRSYAEDHLAQIDIRKFVFFNLFFLFAFFETPLDKWNHS
jgi:hypothetical protein